MNPSSLRVPLTYAVIGCYLFLMFLGPHLLPDKFSFDAKQITDMIETGVDGTGSYAMTAQLMASIPDYLLYPLIAAIGIFSCMLFMGGATFGAAQAAAVVLLVPLLTLGLMRPQKEVVVVAMGLLVLLATLKTDRPWKAFAVIAALYGVYGVFVRDYFLLILGAFLFSMVFSAARPGWRILLVLLAVAGVLLMPEGVFMKLQGNRDWVNTYRVLGTEGNNTIFNNPYTPDGPFAFILNYVYATIRLNVPLLFHLTPQAVFLMLTVGLYMLFNAAAQRAGDWRARMLSSLFVGHILVLMLFEPDLGSYLRHISSVVLYIWPGFMLWQAGRGHTVAPGARHAMMPFLPAQFAGKQL